MNINTGLGQLCSVCARFLTCKFNPWAGKITAWSEPHPSSAEPITTAQTCMLGKLQPNQTCPEPPKGGPCAIHRAEMTLSSQCRAGKKRPGSTVLRFPAQIFSACSHLTRLAEPVWKHCMFEAGHSCATWCYYYTCDKQQF